MQNILESKSKISSLRTVLAVLSGDSDSFVVAHTWPGTGLGRPRSYELFADDKERAVASIPE